MAKVSVELEMSDCDIVGFALGVAIDRVNGSMMRCAIPAAKEAMRKQLLDMRVAKQHFEDAVIGQRQLMRK